MLWEFEQALKQGGDTHAEAGGHGVSRALALGLWGRFCVSRWLGQRRKRHLWLFPSPPRKEVLSQISSLFREVVETQEVDTEPSPPETMALGPKSLTASSSACFYHESELHWFGAHC